ncbi:MAG: hypothetical protein M3436_05525 [Pseudomonadota bacterium]|nr:hypothetical protein [Pseudomonadota bacterium]
MLVAAFALSEWDGAAPVRAAMVDDPPRWTSHRASALGQFIRLLSPHPTWLGGGWVPVATRKARNLFDVIAHLQKREGVHVEVRLAR